MPGAMPTTPAMGTMSTMPAMQKMDTFLERNKKMHTPLMPPSIAKMQEMGRKAGGAPGVCIITCSDPRVNPEDFMGLKRGEAAIIRNAGGRVSDAFRTLYILNSIVPMGVVVVIHHEDCGSTMMLDADVRKSMMEIAPSHKHEIEGMTFGEIRDVDVSIREDMKLLKSSPYLRKDTVVIGYCLDIHTSQLREIK